MNFLQFNNRSSFFSLIESVLSRLVEKEIISLEQYEKYMVFITKDMEGEKHD